MGLEEKVELVRKNVISAVQKYKDELVGKKFLYIFDEQFIEVIYKTENFMHLTGIDSKKLKSQKFYEKTKDGTLKGNEIELDYYIPKTFRVKEDATKDQDPTSVVEITMILSKTDVEGKYNKIHYGNVNEILSLPDKIKALIDENLIPSDFTEESIAE